MDVKKLRTGMSLIELVVVILVVSILLSILLVGINRVRMKARMLACSSNLRQVGLACQSYESTFRVLPPYGSPSEFPHQGGLFRLLPFLELSNLSSDFRTSDFVLEFEYRTPPRHARIEVLRCPSSPSDRGAAYRLNTGASGYVLDSPMYPDGGDGPFVRNRPVALVEISRGMSQVVLFAERSPGTGYKSTLDSIYPTRLTVAESIFPAADVLNERCVQGAIVHDYQDRRVMNHGGWGWHMTGLVESGYNHVCTPNREYSCIVEGAIGVSANLGGVIPATSYHASQVNVFRADGSVASTVDLSLWRSIGRRD